VNRPRDPVTKYAKDVAAGRIVAGPYVRGACARHLDDMLHAKERGWTFDRVLLGRVLAFFSGVLRLNAGEFEGAPFHLSPWQAFIVGSLFAWVDADGARRFRVCYIETGKGSGKSPLAAGIGLYMLLADNEPRSEVYAAASKKDQAMVLFRDAVAMVQLSPSIARRVRIIGGVHPYNISYTAAGSFFRAIASDDSQSGPRPHCALVDELHEHRDATVVEMLRAGFKGRRSPLLFMITNSGFDRESVCWRYHQHAISVSDRTLDDDRFFGFVCALDKGDDPFASPACWGKTNPNLGLSIRADYIADQVHEAKQMPAKESEVRRLHFCEWTDAASPWISGEAWRACEVEPRPLEDAFAGLPVVLSVDLSQTTDLTALAVVADTEAGIFGGVEFWTPADTLAARAERDGVPYPLWEKQGHIHTVPGSSLDYGPIALRIAELASTLDVVALVFDRYRMMYLRKELDALGLSLNLVEHPQTFVRVKTSNLWMPHSINELERAILHKTLRVFRNPVLTWAAASAVAITDDQQSRMFSKRKSTGRIDGLVALTMGVGYLRAPVVEVDVAAMIG
jgi:phage terminase large subunit-like protein